MLEMQGRVAATGQILVDWVRCSDSYIARYEIMAVDPRETEREALLRRSTLEAPIVRSAGNDDRAHPFQYFIAFTLGALREIAGEVPREPASLGRAQCGNGPPGRSAATSVQLVPKISRGKPIAVLDPFEHGEALDRSRRSCP
ncbi:hypothetical protein [Sphingopyxis fribergensis]